MSDETTEPKQERKPRGFAACSPEQRRLLASAGGKAAHARGSAHKWTREEASEAGKKGNAKMRENARSQGNGT